MEDKIKVVMIDDDKHLANLLSTILTPDEFEVHTSSDPCLGLDFIREIQPDVVLLDWMMPEKEGIELLADIKKLEDMKQIAVFMMTSKGMLSDVNQLFSTGADDYIAKPFNPALIAKQIKQKLAKFQKRKV